MLSLKGKHPLLYEDTQLLFDHLAACGVRVKEQTPQRIVDKDNGRIEIRQAWVVTDATIIQSLLGTDKWTHLAALVKLEAERRTAVERQTHTCYYLASWPLPLPKFAIALAHHPGEYVNRKLRMNQETAAATSNLPACIRVYAHDATDEEAYCHDQLIFELRTAPGGLGDLIYRTEASGISWATLKRTLDHMAKWAAAQGYELVT